MQVEKINNVNFYVKQQNFLKEFTKYLYVSLHDRIHILGSLINTCISYCLTCKSVTRKIFQYKHVIGRESMYLQNMYFYAIKVISMQNMQKIISLNTETVKRHR